MGRRTDENGFLLDSAEFDGLQEMLDAPPKANEALKALMQCGPARMDRLSDEALSGLNDYAASSLVTAPPAMLGVSGDDLYDMVVELQAFRRRFPTAWLNDRNEIVIE